MHHSFNKIWGLSAVCFSKAEVFGINGQIEYEIIEGDWQHQFSVGKKNGSVFTTKPLDRETLPSYDLVVKATDLAEPSSDRKSTTTQVTVIVKDVNDESPKFVSPSLVYVSENLLVGQLAFYIKAEDQDEGDNGVVTYSLAQHSSNSFRVGFINGEVFVNTALDRESVQNYTIEVVATDKGIPPRSAFQTISVQIKDENDNGPIFERSSYDATVPENVTIGVTLVQVKAKDADIGLNGIVRYFIVGGDENFDFSMDQSSGVLRVQKKLDYERKKLYKLQIQAEDGGMIARSSTATVTINILDINDYQPLFIDSPYYAHVLENMASLPVYVTQVSARDDDSDVNSKVILIRRQGR
ncbi:hypothetical protein KUTeg_024650 [Tegillarca granosa]|uniref:Cadherin domain-containing protein n=1 Tax=Tegillarca granosa TaxID=220873 RepID=A0ABQ9DYH0_TEGGR|nr:hypothetical protein KUTeg_024650 [Tegillarca granosa]